jgi:hypothetical protein
MTDRFESAVDRAIREAQERGEFENLPGVGKPLPDAGREYDEDWWVKDWLRREGGTSGVLPGTLRLRRDVEDLEALADRQHDEAGVRRIIADLNEQLRRTRVGLLDGPPVLVPPFDADAVVRGWRERRQKR